MNFFLVIDVASFPDWKETLNKVSAALGGKGTSIEPGKIRGTMVVKGGDWKSLVNNELRLRK